MYRYNMSMYSVKYTLYSICTIVYIPSVMIYNIHIIQLLEIIIIQLILISYYKSIKLYFYRLVR